MSAGFTKGPWRVSNEGNRVQPTVFGADGSPVASCGGSAPGFGQYAAETYERRDANANLIAAAPSLYAKVEIAAIIFEKYARLHRAKGTPEGDAKAERNEQYAAEMRQMLAIARGEQ